jgi:4-amino-4-deoxy-L-arabinose transferase-like glycosyltransferase
LFVGFGFITKMMQAFLIVPGFGLVYLSFAPTSVRRRIAQLAAALGGIVVGAGWWVVAVMLTPAANRPYVGGSTTNSILQLAFGYNGFGRLTGNETGSVGGGGGGNGGGMWGATGINRLLGSDMGSQISWLLPAALLLALGTIWALGRATEDAAGKRSQLWLWLSWLVVTGLVFSFSKGIIHPYYTVALAPPVGALVGIGGVTLWSHRDELWSRLTLAATALVTVLWSRHLLAASPSWNPWLRTAILIVGVIVVAGLLVPPGWWRGRPSGVGRTVAAGTLVAGALVAGLAGPAAYSVATAATAHSGAIPSAGPSVIGGRGVGVGAPPQIGARTSPGRAMTGMQGGGLLNAGQVGSALTTALQTTASSYAWVAATVGAENASGYQLATGRPVMAIGGFNGTDNAPTLAQFKAYVAAGKIHYFIGGSGLGTQPGGFPGGGPAAGGGGASSAITAWVEATYTATSIGGTTVYDLTSPAR